MVPKVTKKPPHVTATENVRDELLGLFSRPKWRSRPSRPCGYPNTMSRSRTSCSCGGAQRNTRAALPDRPTWRWSSRFVLSLAKDRQRIAIYGTARIPVYWIVNLDARQVEVYTLKRGGYGKARTSNPGESVPVDVDGVRVGLSP